MSFDACAVGLDGLLDIELAGRIRSGEAIIGAKGVCRLLDRSVNWGAGGEPEKQPYHTAFFHLAKVADDQAVRNLKDSINSALAKAVLLADPP